MASVGQLPLGRGEFCTSLAPTPALSVKIRQPLSREDFCLPCTSLAPALLGRTLCRKSPSGTILRAEIVETEAYPAGCPRVPKASHGPGSTFIYSIYGVNKCLNITSEETGACVLLRAAMPLEGVEAMCELRGRPRLKEWELCKGPGNLCRAMGIGKGEDDLDLVEDPCLWVEEGREVSKEEMVVCKRVNVTSATPYRWYIRNCRSVSKRDRVAEKELVLNSMIEEERNLQPQGDSFMWRGQEYSWPAPALSDS